MGIARQNLTTDLDPIPPMRVKEAVMNHVTESSCSIQIAHDVDVVVVGSGAGGVATAVAAARQGASTVLIEKYGSVGGCMTTGGWAAGALDLAPLAPRRFLVAEGESHQTAPEAHWISPLGLSEIPTGTHEYLRGCGLAGEWMARMFDMIETSGPCPNFSNWAERIRYLFNQMLEEAGVIQMLQSYACDPIIENKNSVRGVYVQTVSGRCAVRAKVTIDATANASLSQRAGAPTVPCNKEPSMNISIGIGGADQVKFDAFMQERTGTTMWDFDQTVRARQKTSDWPDPWINEKVIPNINEFVARRFGAHLNRLRPMGDLFRRAYEENGYEAVGWVGDIGRVITLWPWPWQGEAGVVSTRADIDGDVDTLNADHMTMVEHDVRRYVFQTVRFYRKYCPGFENAYVLYLSPYIGTRGGRAIEAEYIVTKQDLIDATRHDDVIHQTYDLRVISNFTDIPFRQLLPKHVEGLLAVGVAAHQKPPNLRYREVVLTMGQAAGIAAAICAGQDISPRQLEIKQLQRVLHESGVNLGEPQRVAKLLA